MRLRSKFRQWTRSKRRKRAAEVNQNEPLREFVYLDEVSVFSLLSSRIGALATDFTDTESSTLSAEVKGSAGVSTPVHKANVSSAIKAGQTSGSQVLRKSTVQSTFKELLGYVRDSLLLVPIDQKAKPPSIGSTADLINLANGNSEWALDSQACQRGELLEIDVELQADEHFRASVVMTTLLDFVDQLPQTPDALDRESLLNAVIGTRLLDHLLAGLVPVRGKAINYSHAATGDRELLVHHELLDQVQALGAEIRPLFVVGVAEQELFWRDVRRVLFSNARYRMLCRVGRDGTHVGWTPVKLLEVLKAAVPSLSAAVEEIPKLIGNMADSDGDDEVESPTQLMRRALQHFAVEVAAIYERPLDVEELTQLGLPTSEQCAGHHTLEERRAAFGDLTDTLARELGFTPEREVLTACRTEALVTAGLLAVAPEAVPDTPQASTSPEDAVRYLDCEIVAVYW